jgi:hypothetical protein
MRKLLVATGACMLLAAVPTARAAGQAGTECYWVGFKEFGQHPNRGAVLFDIVKVTLVEHKASRNDTDEFLTIDGDYVPGTGRLVFGLADDYATIHRQELETNNPWLRDYQWSSGIVSAERCYLTRARAESERNMYEFNLVKMYRVAYLHGDWTTLEASVKKGADPITLSAPTPSRAKIADPKKAEVHQKDSVAGKAVAPITLTPHTPSPAEVAAKKRAAADSAVAVVAAAAQKKVIVASNQKLAADRKTADAKEADAVKRLQTRHACVDTTKFDARGATEAAARAKLHLEAVGYMGVNRVGDPFKVLSADVSCHANTFDKNEVVCVGKQVGEVQRIGACGSRSPTAGVKK